MNTKSFFSILTLILVLFLLDACAPKLKTSSTPTETPSLTDIIKKTGEKQEWQMEWERVLEGSKKEGKVVIMATWRPEARLSIAEAFKAKYGIDSEYILGRGGELATKLHTERKAGLYTVDLFIAGSSPFITLFKPREVFAPFEQLLIIPEVKDPKLWLEGKLPFIDKDHLVFFCSAFSSENDIVVINPKLVNKEEIKLWKDLLDSKWKGKISMFDPTTPGRGQKIFSVLLEYLGVDYWREFTKQQPAFSRDHRLLIEWLNGGKYPIALATLNEIYTEFQKAGSPIEPVIPKPRVPYLSTGSGNIAFVKESPHPNATKVFINWFLNKEAQTLFAKETDWPSSRLDVPTDFITPDKVIQPGIEYLNTETEESLMKQAKRAELAKEIFGPLLR